MSLSATARAALDALPRVSLASLPTPVQEAPRLAAEIGLDRLLIKREDLTGLAFGGNKARELDLILGEALRDGADTFVAGGGAAQSNHARQCAAAARAAGLKPVLVLRRGLRGNELAGNLLMTRLLCDEIHWIDDDPGLADRDSTSQEMDRVADALRKEGRHPWVLHSSFHPLAAAAYIDGGLELVAQLRAQGIERAHVVCTSMGATHAGLRLALAIGAPDWPITAIGWRPLQAGLAERLRALAVETAELLQLPVEPQSDWFETLDHGGPAYGVPNEQAMRMLVLAARTEGLLLDPVYTAKGMAGLQAGVQSGTIDPALPVVFVHTGGTPALFAYGDELIHAVEHESERTNP